MHPRSGGGGGGGGGTGSVSWIQQVTHNHPAPVEACPDCLLPPPPPPKFACVNSAIDLPANFNWQVGVLAGGGIEGNTLNVGNAQRTVTVRANSPCVTSFELNVVDSFPDGPGEKEFCVSTAETFLACANAAPTADAVRDWIKHPETIAAFGGSEMCADAVQHASLLCALTSAIDAPMATALGEAHENTNLGKAGPQDQKACVDGAMDLTNNDFAINVLGPEARAETGTPFKLDLCQTKALEALRRGDLVVRDLEAPFTLHRSNICQITGPVPPFRIIDFTVTDLGTLFTSP